MTRNRNTLIITLLYGVLPGISFIVLRLLAALIFGEKIGVELMESLIALPIMFLIFGLVLGVRVADRNNLK